MTIQQIHKSPERIRTDVRKAVQAAYVCIRLEAEMRSETSPAVRHFLAYKWANWAAIISEPVELWSWD